jgi:hypothetical protein
MSITASSKKKLPTCKPDPVPASALAYTAGGHHLSGPCITAGIYLPTLRRWLLAEPSDEPSSTTGIRGISACKVYPRRRSPAGAVGSYPTFSSSPRNHLGSREAVIFCGTLCKRFRASRLLTGALPCAVRTFLRRVNGSDDPVGSGCKDKKRRRLRNVRLIKTIIDTPNTCVPCPNTSAS